MTTDLTRRIARTAAAAAISVAGVFPATTVDAIGAPATTATAATATTAVTAVGSAPLSHGPRTVLDRIDVRPVAELDAGRGESAENLTVLPGGAAVITVLGGQDGGSGLLRVEPDGRTTRLYSAPDGAQTTGLTRASDGAVYFNQRSDDAPESGIYRLGAGGAAARVAALPAGSFPNGLVLDERAGRFYTPDTEAGVVHVASRSGGQAATWLRSDALAPTQPAPNRFGANGIVLRDGALWISNTNRGTVVEVPVRADGSAGGPRTVFTGLQGIDDFDVLPPVLTGGRPGVVAAINDANEIRVEVAGTAPRTLLDSSDGLANPTSVTVSGTRALITNAAFAPGGAGPSVLSATPRF